MFSSPFDHPHFRDLLGDPETAGAMSAETEVLAMLAFEIALAQAEADAGVIPADAADAIRERLTAFVPPPDTLERGMAADGVIGPSFVRLLRESVGEPYARFVHFGATSQDLVDSGLMIRLKMLADVLRSRLAALDSTLEDLARRFGDRPLMGRTRMRAALPITVFDRLATWAGPLRRAATSLPDSTFAVQFGGPVGTLSDLGDRKHAVRAALAEALGLADAPVWHAERDRIATIASWLAGISGSLGKMGQDVSLMAQDGICEIGLSGGGGSSAMPHKQNPVRAEVLVALARYSATLVSGIYQAQVHEQERSGAAWTLEWLVLPQLAACAGAGLRIAADLLGQVEWLGEADGGANG